MKTKLIALSAAIALLPLAGIAQPNPPNPPNAPAAPVPPVPPNPPGPRNHMDKEPKVPVTFLGVETSTVPRVVSEQLGLPKGFGLVVDYVVPDGPAGAAGVQQNDILKMLNDQILMEPSQLSKLIRSYNEGTTVTLTVLRKGQEQKISVKLSKKEVPQRRAERGGFRMGNIEFGDIDFSKFGEGFGMRQEDQDEIHDAVMAAHEQVAQAREEALREAQQAREEGLRQGQLAREQAQRARDEAQRVRDAAQRVRDEFHKQRDEARRAQGLIRVTKNDENGSHTTRIDLNKAQIEFTDDKGELRIENNSGKKVLTAKDPQGRLLFSGPVETKEELDKVPAEVRARYEKLQTTDLPSVTSAEDADEDEDNNDNDNDADEADEDDSSWVEQVSAQPAAPVYHSIWNFRTVLI